MSSRADKHTISRHDGITWGALVDAMLQGLPIRIGDDQMDLNKASGIASNFLAKGFCALAWGIQKGEDGKMAKDATNK